MAFTIESVTAFQAGNACRNLFASELSVQSRLMTAQPQGKPFT